MVLGFYILETSLPYHPYYMVVLIWTRSVICSADL